MCVVEVEGEDHPPISCSRAAEDGHGRAHPDRAAAPPAPDEPRADLQRPQRLLPAALPEQVPEPHRHPGLPQGERRGPVPRVGAHLQAHHPVPLDPGPRLPGAVRGALPARRGGRGDRHPRQPPLRRRHGPGSPEGRDRAAAAVRVRAQDRQARGHRRLRSGRNVGRLLPAPLRPRRDGLREGRTARRHAPLRHPRVPPAQGRGPRSRIRGRLAPGRAARGGQGPRPRLQPGRPARPGLRRHDRRHGLLRDEQARRAQRDRRRRDRRPRVPQDRDSGPALSGPQEEPRGGHRRRFHRHGLHSHLDPPGREGSHPRLPPRHEGHAGRERGPRGHRGGRQDHLPGRSDPRPGRREQQGDRRRVHPHAPGRTGRLRPAPPRAGARHGVRHRVRPGPAGHRPGSGPGLDRPGQRGRRGGPVPAQGGRRHLRDRPARRLRHRRRPHRRQHRGPGRRRGPALRLRHGRLPEGRRPGRAADPPEPGRGRAAVPLDRPLHRRAQGAAPPPQVHAGQRSGSRATSSTRSPTPRPR